MNKLLKQGLAYYIVRHMHTMKVMSELIRIVCIHNECAFGKSTSIGGLKANCIITRMRVLYNQLYKETSNKEIKK